MQYIGFILFTILAIYILYTKSTQKKPAAEHEELPKANDENLPYKKKFLLSKNEWSFYKQLKPVADELGYSILAKIRVADLVEVNVPDKKDYMKYFNKINKKHIDFALANPDNLQILLLIELDDSTHKQGNERDDFIEKLYKKTGYKLLRVKGSGNLKAEIEQILELQKTPENSINPPQIKSVKTVNKL